MGNRVRCYTKSIRPKSCLSNSLSWVFQNVTPPMKQLWALNRSRKRIDSTTFCLQGCRRETGRNSSKDKQLTLDDKSFWICRWWIFGFQSKWSRDTEDNTNKIVIWIYISYIHVCCQSVLVSVGNNSTSIQAVSHTDMATNEGPSFSSLLVVSWCVQPQYDII